MTRDVPGVATLCGVIPDDLRRVVPLVVAAQSEVRNFLIGGGELVRQLTQMVLVTERVALVLLDFTILSQLLQVAERIG